MLNAAHDCYRLATGFKWHPPAAFCCSAGATLAVAGVRMTSHSARVFSKPASTLARTRCTAAEESNCGVTAHGTVRYNMGKVHWLGSSQSQPAPWHPRAAVLARRCQHDVANINVWLWSLSLATDQRRVSSETPCPSHFPASKSHPSAGSCTLASRAHLRLRVLGVRDLGGVAQEHARVQAKLQAATMNTNAAR